MIPTNTQSLEIYEPSMTPTTSSTPSDAPQLPQGLLPHDGRFGCGPSKIRPEQIKAIDQGATTIMGTSHRKPGVKNIVASIQEGLTSVSYTHLTLPTKRIV